MIFPYNSLYTQAVAYTTYFELEEPVNANNFFSPNEGSYNMMVIKFAKPIKSKHVVMLECTVPDLVLELFQI